MPIKCVVSSEEISKFLDEQGLGSKTESVIALAREFVAARENKPITERQPAGAAEPQATAEVKPLEPPAGGKPPELPGRGGIPPEGKGPGIFTSQVHPEFTRRATALAREFFGKFPNKRSTDPHVLISDDVMRYVANGEIPTEFLKKYGLTENDFAYALRNTVGDAGRTLAYFSHVFRGVKLTPEMEAALKKAGLNPPDYFYTPPLWKEIFDIWRGILVTLPVTAERNLATQGVKMGLSSIEDSLDSAIQRAIGRTPTVNPLDGFETMLRLWGRNKELVDKILSYRPSERENLFARYMSDVPVPGKEPFSTLVRKGIHEMQLGVYALNIFNRTQEFMIRRAVFVSRLSQRLRNQGIDLKQLEAEGRLGEIKQEDLEYAVDRALDETFAKDPQGKIGKLMVEAVNTIPGVGLAAPYMRFMLESWRFIFEHNPTGLLNLLSEKERNAFVNADTRIVSKALVGIGLLGGAILFRNSQYAGEKWNEGKDEEGKIVDLRPYNPLVAYLGEGEILRQLWKRAHGEGDTMYKLTANDIAQIMLSSNMRAGSGLYILDNFVNNFFGQTGDEKKLERKMQEFSGDVMAGFLQPLGLLRDFYDQITEGKAYIRDVRQEPFLGPIKRQIPGVSQTLPEAVYPTREGPKYIEDPALRQIRSYSYQGPKNPFEKELDRLGFEGKDVIGSSGEPNIDRQYKELMGKLSERVMIPLVQSEKYALMNDARKGVVLDEVMKELATDVKKAVDQNLPEDQQIALVVKHLPKRIRILLKQEGVIE